MLLPLLQRLSGAATRVTPLYPDDCKGRHGSAIRLALIQRQGGKKVSQQCLLRRIFLQHLCFIVFLCFYS